MIQIDDRQIELQEVLAIARGARVCLCADKQWRNRLEKSRRLLEASLEDGRSVYGVSTGVGHRSSETISADAQQRHAYEIVRHHGCGVGEPLGEEEVRAALFARLVSLAKGCSAVRIDLLQALCHLLNAGLHPVIPRLGSVGASGDLTPLSYVAAVLIGEREATLAGAVLSADEALRRAGLEPLRLAAKETLALM